VGIPLSNAALSALRARGVRTPEYRRDRIAPGVLHFGPGAFHRVHQAVYFDDLLHRDPRWGICEVALQSAGVRDALKDQDGLYVLCVLDAKTEFRVIGAACEYLVARESSEAVLQRFAASTTNMITATITEKGYCLTPQGGLDFTHDAIRRDLNEPESPVTFVGYVVEGLRRRKAAKLPAPTIVSCDNLTDNGNRLRRSTLEFARERDVELATWIENEVSFPRTMVDSITPATDDVLRARVLRETSVEDRWPVQREAFSQWVIEDSLRGVQPDLASVGAILTNNVDGYEIAKLRLLNGTHSTLAYLGSLAGYETVSQAIGDPRLDRYIDSLMSEIKPSIVAPQGFDVDAYIASLIRRFRNPALPHRLAQIAWDGSQKVPYRLLGTMRDNLAAGRSIECLGGSIAAWFHFIRRRAVRGEPPVDPLAAQLSAIGSACVGDSNADVDRFLAMRQVFPADLAALEGFRASIVSAYWRFESLHSAADLQSLLFGAA
jgi:fructuronate reductase